MTAAHNTPGNPRQKCRGAYNIETGQKCIGELNTCATQQLFFKLCVHSDGNILALVNQDEETILFAISQLFDCAKTDAQMLTEVKKGNWVWSYRSKKSKGDSSLELCRMLGKVLPPSGLVVSYMHFSLKGFFVFYSILGQSKCNTFKVVNESTAEVVYNFSGLVESRVVPGGPLPLIMTDSILSVCLGLFCNDYFTAKLCDIVPNFAFSEDLDRSMLCQDRNGSEDFHKIFLRIILSLHLNVFRSSLLNLRQRELHGEGDQVEHSLSRTKEMDKTWELFKVVLEYKDVGTDVKDEMLEDCFLHAVRLLELTQVERKSTNETDLFTNLLKQILLLYDSIKISESLKHDWGSWMDMTDERIIQEAVVAGSIGLAHVFFVTSRKWSIEETEIKFNTEAHAWIIHLISTNQLDKAKAALVNMGYDPVQHLKCLCLDTNDCLLRNILITHLVEQEECTAEEVKSWIFNKRLESALSSAVKRSHTYVEKMTVSEKDWVKAVAFKLNSAFGGSLDLRTVMNVTEENRHVFLAEVYFSTGDASLEKDLEKEVSWQYLIEASHADMLRNWIDICCAPDGLRRVTGKPADYLSRSFFNRFSDWSITENMLDLIPSMKCLTVTKDFVLDTCASYGLFAPYEKNQLKQIVCRLENNSLLSSVRNILSLATSNVSLSTFDEMLLRKCTDHSLKPIILTCLGGLTLPRESPLLNLDALSTDAWKLFSSWDKAEGNTVKIWKEAILMSSSMYACNSLEASVLELAVALNEGKEISAIIDKEKKSCLLLHIPLMEINWEMRQSKIDQQPDVTVYDLLAFSNVQAGKLFLWQSQNRSTPKGTSIHDVFPEFPHFNHQVLGIKFGFRQTLDHIYYLKQSRPSFACNLFVIESLRTQRRLTTKMIKRVCGAVHGLALRFWKEICVGNACISFIAMLGDITSANILRIHLSAIECIYRYLSVNDRFYVGSMAHGVVAKELPHLQEMSCILENSVMANIRKKRTALQLENWSLSVCFCNVHSLPLPTLLLKFLARTHNWFPFIMCMDIFKYPYDQAIELIEEIESKILKSHLIRALTRTTLKLSTTSPSKSPPKILLEPENNGKEETETTAPRDSKDVFHSFVTNIYTEVLNTIQTFTDRNIVLPWSCEQDPENDLLLTLLKCESEPDTSKSLLVSSIELLSPVLAILATCFQSDNVFPSLIAWLVASIPTCMSRMKRREEGQRLVDRSYSSSEIDALLVNVFSTGYFQTFYRGMHLFMPDNPMTLFLKAIHHSIVLLDFETGLELLKEFTVDISHFRIKDLAFFYSKEFILNMVSRCINSLLARPDLENSRKRRFLRILAESDLSSVDSCFPNYLLWSQICEILESSERNLDFIQLCDVPMVSHEPCNCLDVLVKNHQFAQALEICSLLSLNKDQFVVALWKHQFDEALKTDANIDCIWSESSLAFKDENVNPNLAASFYYNMASHFQSSSADSLRKRYVSLDHCLRWRRLMEDTLSATFREESDSIELEKWKCCIEPNFDIGLLNNFDPVDATNSLLISVRSATKILIRSQALDDPQSKHVENLINMFLECGNLFKALRLSAFFKCNNQDLILLTSCLKVTQEEVTPSDLTNLNSVIATTPKKFSPSIHTQFSDGVDLSDYEMIPSNEQNQLLYILDKLCQRVEYGKSLAKKIFVCYRLSVYLDLTFKDVASERDYLSLLSRTVALEGINRFNVATDLITLADLSQPFLAKLLKDRIVAAVLEFNSTDLAGSPTLWDVSLDEDFHLIMNLAKNPSILGSELLQATANLPCRAAIEVLIRAHDCFTTSCNVEGIGRVLRRARILTSVAVQEEQWHHLVRLLVGIKRYSDMSYIFRALQDNGQFEQLLRKGMQKVRGLHVAISEFLQRRCPQDREIRKMVAAHFGLHSKVATFWQEDADEIISSLSGTPEILKDSGKTRQALNLALDNYSHAVQWFLQAGKLNRALRMAHKAQIVSLQISLLGGPFILKIESRRELQCHLNQTLSVAQAVLISRAFDYEPDWICALHERWVLKGDKTFYADLKSSSILCPQLIEGYFLRYELEGAANAKVKDRVKQLMIITNQTQSPLSKDFTKHC
ncbi:hypothetical protein RUM44_011808 [Polyplax serrata]|uniref:Spatacsin C-terminal domain-containing protein n=1 Tax=Polyplax serrata TaxID=468196 RepID=A0ABR1ARC4_POLSC